MAKVDVIKAQVSVTDRRRRSKSIERKRVAAYCRISTDSEDQLNSYRSQVQYYTDKISENVDWMMAGIYADEAITGTQVAKREGFQKMINDCMSGQIDMVITKSISRFARNTLDTLKYVRMLKEKDIAVFFGDENINTLSMDGELLLVGLSAVAQQEVENIFSNVKKGLAMKMSRGEIVGFAGALGYDYDPETKSISVNEEEAKIVQYIFKRYIEGMGSHVIAGELEQMGALTNRGNKSWYDSTVLGIIKNEKYKGDLLQGKTFTVDPITKRRLGNLGEVDQYLMKDHHETVALLSKLDVDKHIDVEIKLDELDLTSAESKATYAQIKQYILEKFDLKVSTLYIAQIKKKCGIALREHYNKSKKEKQVIPQCTPEKEEAIMDALRHFKMI